MIDRVLRCMALAVLMGSLSGCLFVNGNSQDNCKQGGACVCSGIGNCDQHCQSGHCAFECRGIGNCIFTCEGGGCALLCANTGNCILSCPGGNCTQTCQGTGNCLCTDCGFGDMSKVKDMSMPEQVLEDFSVFDNAVLDHSSGD